MRSRDLTAFIASVAAGCSSPPQQVHVPAASVTQAPSKDAPKQAAPPPASAAVSSSAPIPKRDPRAAPEPVAVPAPAAAKPGDGAWAPLEGARLVEDAPVLFTTTLHPDATKPYAYVTIVAGHVDDVQVRMLAGTREPVSKELADEKRTGLIPEEERQRLVAVHNGGFQTEHGHWTMQIDGVLLYPVRAGGCLVALSEEGKLSIFSESLLASRADDAHSFREAPPCLLEESKANPGISTESSTRRWGAAKGGDLNVRRTAIAVDESQKWIYFAFGDWVSATTLTRALRASRARDAAELDINWSFTKFVSYSAESPSVETLLVKDMKHIPREHVERPAPRDFFYWILRDPKR